MNHRNPRRSRLCAAAVAIALPLLASAQQPAPLPTDAEAAAMANMQLGISYMKQGNLALARDKIDKALKQAPRNVDVQTTAALLEERLGNLKKAEEHHRTAMKTSVNRPDITNNFAVFLCRTNRAKQGVKLFVEVATNKLYPAPQNAYTNAGVCARADKQLDQAAGYFRRALQARPNHAEAVVQLVDLEVSRNRLTEARTEVDGFLKAFLPTPDVLLSCVQVARAQKDRLAEERCGRRLRTEFGDSDAARRLQALNPIPR
jgi:type IV pilus assembly protein PilF